MTSFLGNISPSIRIKCTSLVFMTLVEKNIVLATISRIKRKDHDQRQDLNDSQDGSKNHLSKIVERMQVQLSMPEDKVIVQGDEAWENTVTKSSDFVRKSMTESEKDAHIKMYIIQRGECVIKQLFESRVSTKKMKDGQEPDPLGDDVRTLVDAELFGEISLVYKCQRTCSVVSKNYCTLATISRPDYEELKRDITLSNFEQQLKKNMVFYNDNVRLFIEYEMNKISWFTDLPPLVKNDIVFSMKH